MPAVNLGVAAIVQVVCIKVCMTVFAAMVGAVSSADDLGILIFA